jgi:hypothetical protein
MAKQTRTPKAAATAASQIYVNLPVKDLKKPITYFTALGFTLNRQFTDTASCMIVGVMSHRGYRNARFSEPCEIWSALQ